MPDSPRRPAGLFFVSDGLRQDLLERYAAEGVMPAMAELIQRGVRGVDGVVPPAPTNTGAGWPTLLTGAWSGKTGAVNNYHHLPTDPVHVGRSGFGGNLTEVETLAEAAERQGLRTLTFEWASSIPPRWSGSVLSYRSFYAARGVVRAGDSPNQANRPLGRGLFETRVTFAPPVMEGDGAWAGLPPSALPPLAASFTLPTQDGEHNPDRVWWLLVTAADATGYDRLHIYESPEAAAPLVVLRSGEWSPASVALKDGRAASLWLKCLELAPDLSRFGLYLTALSRPMASPAALEERVATWEIVPPVTADYGPFQTGLVDETTYVEQALLWFHFAVPALTRLVAEVQPDLLLCGVPLTDEFSHQFLAHTAPDYPGYSPETAVHYEALLRLAYARTDAFFARVRALMPDETVTVISSDHGFAPAWRSVNANLALQRAGLAVLDAEGRATVGSKAVAYGVGGTANVYLNLQGREPNGLVTAEEREATLAATEVAFAELRDEAAPEAQIVAAVLRREAAAALPTSSGPANMAHPQRGGDLVVILQPPYQFDGATAGALVTEAPLLGQHGYLPDLIDPARGIHLRSAFLMAGPGVRAGLALEGGRAIDLAPTLARALGIEGPRDADGVALDSAFESGENTPDGG